MYPFDRIEDPDIIEKQKLINDLKMAENLGLIYDQAYAAQKDEFENFNIVREEFEDI